MGLASLHEDIADKILSNLDVPDDDPEFRELLDSLTRKFGSQLGKAIPEYQKVKPRKECTPRSQLARILALLIAHNRHLEQDLRLTRLELRRMIKKELLPTKIGRKSPIIRELLDIHHAEVIELKGRIKALQTK